MNPIIRVILSAVDDVTGVAKKAGDGVVSFSDRAKSALGSLAALGVGAALGAFFKSAIDEAKAAEVQLGRLGTAVGNAGGDFKKLQPELEATVAAVMRLSTATDDDLREALTRTITISKDVAGSQANLGLVTDLAAYKQIGLSEAADIVGKAMNGNVTAMNKLGVAGKDATTVIENARAQFGGFAASEAATLDGKLTQISNLWGEFQEAVGNAVLAGGEAGTMVDGLAGVLGQLAGWVEANESGISLLTGALGDAVGAVVDVAGSLWQVFGPALTATAKLAGGALVFALNTAAYGVRGLAAAFQYTAGASLEALGFLVQKGGALLKVFGVSVVQESGTSLRQFGEALRTQATEDMARANDTYADGMRRLITGQREHVAEVERVYVKGGAANVKAISAAQKKALEAAKDAETERVRATEEATRLILLAADKLQKGLEKTGGSWKDIKEQTDKAYGAVLNVGTATQSLKDAAHLAAKENDSIREAAEKAEQKTKDNIETTKDLGKKFSAAAVDMGLITEEGGRALDKIGEMGAAVAEFGLGSPEGILTIVGGLASLIGGWGSSAVYKAQQEAALKNTRAIEELTRDLGDYNGAASGRVFSGVASALQEESDVRGGAPFLSRDAIEQKLRARGLTLADAQKLADKYGIDVVKDQEGWSKLLAVLNSRKFGSGQGNFTDELASLTDSFDVLGVDDADDRLKAFRSFAEKNIPILAEALQGDLTSDSGRAAVSGRLRALYRDSIDAKISPAQYKNATPQQFRQLIATLLPLLGDANGVLAGGGALGTGTSSTPIGGPPPVGGSVGLAASGGGTLGAPGLPALGGGVEALGSVTLGGGVTVNGGLHVSLPLLVPASDGPDAFAERVAVAVERIMLTQYDLVVAARGTVTQVAA